MILEVESTTCFEWSLSGCPGFFIHDLISDGITEFEGLRRSMATTFFFFAIVLSRAIYENPRGPKRRKKKKRSRSPSLGTEVLVWVLGDVKSLIGQKWYKVQEKRSIMFGCGEIKRNASRQQVQMHYSLMFPQLPGVHSAAHWTFSLSWMDRPAGHRIVRRLRLKWRPLQPALHIKVHRWRQVQHNEGVKQKP